MHNANKQNAKWADRRESPPARKKVLLIEDNRDFREAMTVALVSEGFEVITAADGEDGLNRARAENPDVVVTDLNIPGIDGLKLIQILKNEVGRKNPPVIAITAHGEFYAKLALMSGATSSFTKPVVLDRLIEDIKAL